MIDNKAVAIHRALAIRQPSDAYLIGTNKPTPTHTLL